MHYLIILLIVILWITFAIMAFSNLSTKNHLKNQVLGVSLSKEHFQHTEVKEVIESFKKANYMVLFISMVLSLLLFIPFIQPFGEIYLLVLVFLNLYFNWRIYHKHGSKLIAIKQKNNWIYAMKNTKIVDLNVSKEKGKSSVSSFWVWLFFLISFIPTLVSWLNPNIQEVFPIVFTLIGPLTQLLMVYLFYNMRNMHSKVLDVKTDINIAYAQQEERINSITATLSAFFMLIFWYIFNFAILFVENGLAIILAVVVLTGSLMIIGRWHQKKMSDLDKNLYGSLSDDIIEEDGPKWKWGCYYDPNDHRIMVPKRMSSMGMTINIGRPAGKAILGGTILLLVATMGLVIYGSIKDYEITILEDKIAIDAPMYDIDVEKDELLSIAIIEKMPGGTRTNGYGGMTRSYGNFNINQYGRAKLYVYNDINRFIVLELDGDNPNYVFINSETVEETESLYNDIKNWAEN